MQQILEFIQHQALLFGCLSAILFCLVFLEWRLRVKGPKLLAPTEATLLMNHQDAQVIDIRTIAAFNQGHILGAKQIAQDKLASLAEKDQIDKTKPVIIICERGNSAKTAGGQLLAKGFTKVYCLDGGIMAWREENLPLTKISNQK